MTESSNGKINHLGYEYKQKTGFVMSMTLGNLFLFHTLLLRIFNCSRLTNNCHFDMTRIL